MSNLHTIEKYDIDIIAMQDGKPPSDIPIEYPFMPLEYRARNFGDTMKYYTEEDYDKSSKIIADWANCLNRVKVYTHPNWIGLNATSAYAQLNWIDDYDFIFVINDDIMIAPGAINFMYHAMDQYEEYAHAYSLQFTGPHCSPSMCTDENLSYVMQSTEVTFSPCFWKSKKHYYEDLRVLLEPRLQPLWEEKEERLYYDNMISESLKKFKISMYCPYISRAATTGFVGNSHPTFQHLEKYDHYKSFHGHTMFYDLQETPLYKVTTKR